MHLLLVRHGEVLSNIRKIYAGKSTEKLTKRGELQAKNVSEKLKQYDVAAIYSSPVQRAVQTAKIIGDAMGMDIIIDDAFREMELGPWEGMAEQEIAKSYVNEWQIWLNNPAELKLPHRETLEELMRRVLRGIHGIYQSWLNKKVVIVTHVAIIRVLLLWHKKKNLNLYKTLPVPNAEVFMIRIDTVPNGKGLF